MHCIHLETASVFFPASQKDGDAATPLSDSSQGNGPDSIFSFFIVPRRNNNSLPSVAWWASAWNIVNVDRRSSAKPHQRENFLSREAQINLRQITFDIGGTGKGSTRLFATALRVWKERFRQFMGRIFNHAPSTKGKPYTLRGANIIWKINIYLCAERAVWLIHPIGNPKFWMRQRINYGNVNICSVKANKIDTRTIPCRVVASRSNIVQIIWELCCCYVFVRTITVYVSTTKLQMTNWSRLAKRRKSLHKG